MEVKRAGAGRQRSQVICLENDWTEPNATRTACITGPSCARCKLPVCVVCVRGVSKAVQIKVRGFDSSTVKSQRVVGDARTCSRLWALPPTSATCRAVSLTPTTTTTTSLPDMRCFWRQTLSSLPPYGYPRTPGSLLQISIHELGTSDR